MARPKRFPKLTGDEAIAALRWLVATRRIRAAEIRRALAKRQQLVQEIRQELEELGGQGLRFLRGPEALERRPPRRKRRRKVTAAQQAAWREQGRYLAAMRPLSKTDRARVKKIRLAKGVGPALAAAKKLAG